MFDADRTPVLEHHEVRGTLGDDVEAGAIGAAPVGQRIEVAAGGAPPLERAVGAPPSQSSLRRKYGSRLFQFQPVAPAASQAS